MAKALGLGGDERSNFILVQRPDEDGNYSSNKEIQEGKEVQYHAVSPEDLLLPQIQPGSICLDAWSYNFVYVYKKLYSSQSRRQRETYNYEKR